MLTSARNTLTGKIKTLHSGTVLSEITLEVGATTITATLTNDSLQDLGFTVGDDAFALIKASSIILAKKLPQKLSARNLIPGHIVTLQNGAVNSEVIIEIGGAKLTSIITQDAVKDLNLQVGDAIFAIFKASSVIIGA